MESIARVGTSLMGFGGGLLVVEAILMFADAAVSWLPGLVYGVLGVGLLLWAVGTLAGPRTGFTE
jgi:hypothetical protein